MAAVLRKSQALEIPLEKMLEFGLGSYHLDTLDLVGWYGIVLEVKRGESVDTLIYVPNVDPKELGVHSCV